MIKSTKFSVSFEAEESDEELDFEEELEELDDDLEDFFFEEDDFEAPPLNPPLPEPPAKATAPGMSGVPFPLEFIYPCLNKFSVCL